MGCLVAGLTASNLHLKPCQIRRSPFHLPILNKHFPTNTYKFPLNRNGKPGQVLILDLIVLHLHLVLRQIWRSSLYLPALNKHLLSNAHRLPLSRNNRTIPKLCLTGAIAIVSFNGGNNTDIVG